MGMKILRSLRSLREKQTLLSLSRSKDTITMGKEHLFAPFPFFVLFFL
jgi:hypothetical protein